MTRSRDSRTLRRLSSHLFPGVYRPWWWYLRHPFRPGGYLWRFGHWLYLRDRNREIRAEALRQGKPWPPIGSYDWRYGFWDGERWNKRPWRGEVWGSAQTAVDEANQHRAVTK